jgi:hypothetical protein
MMKRESIALQKLQGLQVLQEVWLLEIAGQKPRTAKIIHSRYNIGTGNCLSAEAAASSMSILLKRGRKNKLYCQSRPPQLYS